MLIIEKLDMADVQIRQLAAVELRKRISNRDGRMWKKTDQSVRAQIKEALLGRLTQEPT